MRILHTADWHFGRTLEGRSRQAEQEAFVDELTEIVREQQIDLVLIAGDVYDSVNPPAFAERLFYDSLMRLAEGGKRQVVVIAGNHDHPDRLSASAPLAAEQGIALIGLPDQQLRQLKPAGQENIVHLYALPYPSESRLKELLTDDLDESALRQAYSHRIGQLIAQHAAHYRKDTINLVMSHLYVLGGDESDSERPIQVGGAYTVHADVLCPPGIQYAALGHLHRPQTLKAPAPVRYSGSPLAYSFSEAGQAKSVTIADIVPGKPPLISELPLSSGRPLVHWRAKGGIAEIHKWLEDGRDARAWIDLEIHLTEALTMEQIQGLRKQHDGIVNIRPIYAERSEEDSAKTEEGTALPVDEIFRRFYRKQTGGGEAEPALVQLFMQLLLDVQEHRDDDGDAEVAATAKGEFAE